MIFVRLYGGMGNQMLQYAFARHLQIIYKQEIVFDVSNGTEYASSDMDRHKNTVLDDFCIPSEGIYCILDAKIFRNKAGIGIVFADFLDRLPRAIRKMFKNNDLYRRIVRFNQKLFNKRGFYTAFDCYYTPEINPNLERIYVNGLFTCSKYFSEIREFLLKEFVPKQPPNKINQHYLNFIKNTESVCVHVRKGSSYLNNDYLNVCTESYFINAVQIMKKEVPDAHFFIFTNDKQWCEENLSLAGDNVCFVDANDSQHAVDELWLMKSCKHFILSNSTMSWWAQFLCENNNKVVISPSKWTKGEIELMGDLIEDEWIKI